MNFIKKRVVAGERVFGTWCNIGSSMTVEMAGLSGLDWVLIDLEHGSGDHGDLGHQLQAASATPATPIVRVGWNDAVQIKRVLDLGAAGIMVPYVQTREEAVEAVRAMRYPPEGIRGAAKLTRAAAFGAEFNDYFARANHELLTVLQVETPKAIENVEEIAAVDGVDVLFVGPLDLSTGMGIQDQYESREFLDALKRVGDAASANGKAAGILMLNDKMLEPVLERGFTFIALGSDGGMVASGMRSVAETLGKHR